MEPEDPRLGADNEDLPNMDIDPAGANEGTCPPNAVTQAEDWNAPDGDLPPTEASETFTHYLDYIAKMIHEAAEMTANSRLRHELRVFVNHMKMAHIRSSTYGAHGDGDYSE